MEESILKKFPDLFTGMEIPAKTVLLHEGEISTRLFFIKKGCLRMWFNKDGREISFQFFTEGQVVASLDSFLSRQPSMFTLDCIEPSVVYFITKADFDKLHQLHPELNKHFQEILFQRFRNYARLFLSRIKDSPRERYEELARNHPEIIQRIPQHYIASYLGITPVSLSRIRNRR